MKQYMPVSFSDFSFIKKLICRSHFMLLCAPPTLPICSCLFLAFVLVFFFFIFGGRERAVKKTKQVFGLSNFNVLKLFEELNP